MLILFCESHLNCTYPLFTCFPVIYCCNGELSCITQPRWRLWAGKQGRIKELPECGEFIFWISPERLKIILCFNELNVIGLWIKVLSVIQQKLPLLLHLIVVKSFMRQTTRKSWRCYHKSRSHNISTENSMLHHIWKCYQSPQNFFTYKITI